MSEVPTTHTQSLVHKVMLSYRSARTLGVPSDGGYPWKTARNLCNRGSFPAPDPLGWKGLSESERRFHLIRRSFCPGRQRPSCDSGAPAMAAAPRLSPPPRFPRGRACVCVCVHMCVHGDQPGRDEALSRLLTSRFSIRGCLGWERRPSSSCKPTTLTFLCADCMQWNIYNMGAGFHEKERYKNAGPAPN